MKKISILFILSCSFIMAGCIQPEQKCKQDTDLEESIVRIDEDQYNNEFVRIKVTEQKALEIERDLNDTGYSYFRSVPVSGIVHIKRTFPYAGRFEKRTREEKMHLWYDVELDKSKMNLTKANYSLINIDGIEKVELQPKFIEFEGGDEAYPLPAGKGQEKGSQFFNDPMLKEQWHYKNDGSLKNSVAGADINVEKVWKEFTKGNESVIVCVVDGGIDFTHPDLKENLWVNEKELKGEPEKDDDGNGYVDDIYGYNFVRNNGMIFPANHGTHVAGTISAVNNNELGVCGIAGGDHAKGEKGVRVMSAQIFEGKMPGDIAAAIKYGADNGAVISQNSWGYGVKMDHIVESERLAIDYFIKYAGLDENGNQEGPMKGGIVICASGNDNSTICYPAKYEKTLSVSSIDAAYLKPIYSNYGKWVQICAPGGDKGKDQPIASTIIKGLYGYLDGTSMACPHVSGIAALLVSYFGKEPGFTAHELKTRLINSGRDISSYHKDFYYQHQIGPLVDAYNAFTFTSTAAPETPQNVFFDIHSNNLICQCSVPADPDEDKAYGFGIYYSKEAFKADIDRENLSSSIHYYKLYPEHQKVGETFKGIIPDLDFETEYYVAVDAFDLCGNKSVLSTPIKIRTAGNTAPEADVKTLEFSMKSHEIQSKTFRYEDKDWHAVSCLLVPENEAISIAARNGKAEVTVDALKTNPGKFTGKIILSDKYGLSSEVPVLLNIQENHAPEAIGKIKNMNFNKNADPQDIDLKNYFRDIDGEKLNYRCDLEKEGIITTTLYNGILKIAPVEYGLTDVRITATDTRGASGETIFKVLVVNASDNSISVYPNPVTDFMFIGVSKEMPAIIKLTGPLGQIICNNEGTLSPYYPTKIDLRNQESGAYTLTIKTRNEVITKNIVKL